MNEKAKIVTIYAVAAVICAVVIGGSIWLRNARAAQAEAATAGDPIRNAGAAEPAVLNVLTSDLQAVNQNGETISLSDLDDKVWVVNQFFANCPICVQQNSGDMVKLYKEFKDHPDFHLVSITVDPERDTPETLSSYAQAVGASSDNWWFLTGDKEELYRFLNEEMKFTATKENPEAVGAKRFAHDFGVQVYARDRRMVRVRDLVSGKAISEAEHTRRFEALRERIALRLAEPLPKEVGVN